MVAAADLAAYAAGHHGLRPWRVVLTKLAV
jgi:nitroreductase